MQKIGPFKPAVFLAEFSHNYDVFGRSMVMIASLNTELVPHLVSNFPRAFP